MDIALIDDHSIVREGFKRLLELEQGYKVVLEASSFNEAICSIDKAQLDIVILDLSLPDKNGLHLIPVIKSNMPKAKIIIVSMYDSDPYVTDAIDAGANAYISKNNASEELFEAIDNVVNGNSFLGADIIKNIRFDNNKLEQSKVKQLTSREHDIFCLLATGYSIKAISSNLNIMPKTVHAHKANILAKLEVQESFELLKIALKSNSICPDKLISS
ncbi:response regulator transcription factor [Litorilituus lipolyticus]|uniref:Response regulator transcription factor n=1 Tax=Litorilituus lipolyticus TaxID=2491017 RepID=A0A502KQC0_9GAMM|nr:response regulator transcription factor [Litorilituus lipolyticus]TPH13930.1 response regulator transcription factor [Litorilituus lipolyticus]